MRLVYSQEAVADLVRLRAFIAEKDPSAAARVAEELITRIENLCLFPHMGVEVEQAPKPAEVRDMIFANYVVRYSVHTEALAILRIWHHFENRE
ncbi:MAG: type II toxin-antitoxin system RelE/ParE family toxin [Pseudomonadota bacterium]